MDLFTRYILKENSAQQQYYDNLLDKYSKEFDRLFDTKLSLDSLLAKYKNIAEPDKYAYNRDYSGLNKYLKENDPIYFVHRNDMFMAFRYNIPRRIVTNIYYIPTGKNILVPVKEYNALMFDKYFKRNKI